MISMYYDSVFLEHNTGRHPENAGRLRPVLEQLGREEWRAKLEWREWQPMSAEQIVRVHKAEHLDEIRELIGRGGGYIEQDTVVSARSLDAAMKAAGAVGDAVRRVVEGEATKAFCLVRPPGHHALPERPMGFCLLNNVALGARLAIDELSLDRVLIVDWDVHHGNGTQDIFWTDPQVGFFSSHRWPFYPGTGDSHETGSGKGLGTTRNLPIAFGTAREEIVSRFTTELEAFAERLRPQLVIVSAGFDAHRQDPVGSLGLTSEDFEPLTRAVREIAATHCAGRLVSVLEGGYNPAALSECVEVHLRELSRET
ncbi:MAG: histone deacetylase [Planctomycetales bacterium]|nr:histone deacetylase [Planctomycetales bacterium]